MSSPEIPELGLQQIPEVALASQQVRACSRARVPNRVFIRFPNQQFSEVRTINSWDSGLPHVRDSASSPNQDYRILHIREFATSQVPGFRESRIPCSWKICSENFVKPDVSRVTGFPEFPNSPLIFFPSRRFIQSWKTFAITSYSSMNLICQCWVSMFLNSVCIDNLVHDLTFKFTML
jgi:hypothetical protein